MPPLEAPPRIETQAQLGDVVRARRVALGWTQAQAADLLGVSRGFLLRLETGRGDVSLARALAVLKDLGIAVALRVPGPQGKDGAAGGDP